MAPKAKKGKKQQDDWEAELGEDATAVQTNGTFEEQKDPAPEDEANGDAGGGGLLAALKKNKEKRKKKGKSDNDFVEGEDIAAIANGETTEQPDMSAKAPEEATFDDEDDVFASNTGKKGKGGKKEPAKPVEDNDEDNDSVADGAGGVKSKKEKEKEKKEREKQRKKEQVSREPLVKRKVSDLP